MLPPAPSVAVERADAVFEARVENVTGDVAGISGSGLLRYDLEVLRQWKGELGAAVQLSTRANQAACGRNLIVGKVYLIYAHKDDDGALTDTLCSRTRLASSADEDLAVLGPGTSPGSRPVAEPTSREPPRIAPPPPDLGGPAPIARRGCAVGEQGPLAGLLGVAGLMWASRRRRR
jgi:MYXO-CTERM domain-containing protein